MEALVETGALGSNCLELRVTKWWFQSSECNALL
jgi:hypothetical protein